MFRNIGATMTASRKLDHERVFLNFFTTRPYLKNNNCITQL